MKFEGQQRATLFAISAVLCWSTVATAFKLALAEMGVLQLVFYSTLTSAIVLTAASFIGKRRLEWKALKAADVGASAIMGLLNPFAYYLVLFRAYDLLPAQEAQPLNYTWPIVLSLMAALLLRQPLRALDIAAMLLSFIGVFVISTRGEFQTMHFTNIEGVSLAVGSSLVWASYWILNMRSKVEPVVRLAMNFIAGSVYTTVLAVIVGMELTVPISGLGAAMYIGVFEMGLTFVLWMSALRHATNTARINNLVFLSPFLSLIIIAGVLHETIYPSTLLGLVLIVGGILLQQFGRK